MVIVNTKFNAWKVFKAPDSFEVFAIIIPLASSSVQYK